MITTAWTSVAAGRIHHRTRPAAEPNVPGATGAYRPRTPSPPAARADGVAARFPQGVGNRFQNLPSRTSDYLGKTEEPRFGAAPRNGSRPRSGNQARTTRVPANRSWSPR